MPAALEGMKKALELGISLIDTAEVYGGGASERLVGEAIRALGREGFFVASKVAGYRASEDSVIRGARGIASRLGFAPDLLQLHWPPPMYADLCSPIRGLERAVSEGLASYYGLSNFSESLLEEALYCAKRLEPLSNQVQYSLAYRTPELRLREVMRGRGMTLIAWSPLAKGALAGAQPSVRAQRGDRVFKEASWDMRLLSTIREVAERRGATPAQIALAWLIKKEAVPIPGFRDPRRVEEYAGAVRIELSDGEMKALDEASDRYLTLWGRSYGELGYIRLIPAFLQEIFIKISGGI